MFNYTSARYNERLRLNERRLPFNFTELCCIIAKAIDRSTDDIENVAKIAEGGSYRVFEATFRNRFQVIARLPYHSTRPKTFGIASEVATMGVLRFYGCPIPSIYDWSPSASNPLGVEYIIMEKVQGIELQSLWYSMDAKQRMDVVGKMVNFEKRLFEIPLPASGSIYFDDTEAIQSFDKVSIVTDITQRQKHNFCVGPSTEYLWWYQGRNDLAVNPGAWQTPEEVMQAVGKRELAWLKKYGKPSLPHEKFYREIYSYDRVDPQAQMSALSDYLSIIHYLVPEDESLTVPTIRHPDLSPSNIFISETGDITGVIDWQHSVALPLFLQAKMPRHFQNFGDDESESFQPPKLPDNFEDLDDKNKEQQMEIYRRRQLHYFYLGFTSTDNTPHFEALCSPGFVPRNQTFESASKPWEGDNISLKANLIRVMNQWKGIGRTKSSEQTDRPLNYTEPEMKRVLDLDEQQKAAADSAQRLRDIVGVNIDGWVPLEDFDNAVENAASVRAQMLQAADTSTERERIEQHWPLDDYDESY
ncbi:MAG: hypothetical protein Q9160_003855 [Pyrenula sp. 1 TL-2023]